ncbi:transglutaminase family protein [Mangrovihabitans endophyticus]|uniref:Transglutaminase-like domain-containing protein n=1 Tax=Mangrovihabitans endophyticus TaxID=1751298 RepID=A0A8J3BWR7_9ACTN|nr:transglutaminase domain-containing protein [Mangrovihabitans endophyticus]GGK73410.1 hypothetical protein GCM10012284_04110 [Mangrovihabitans endophyticus]
MTALRVGAVVLSGALGGLLFAPVFGLSTLLVPVLVPAAAVLVTTLCARRVAALTDWRPLLATAAGLLAVAETLLWPTTVAGLPTGRTAVALADGVTRSWWRTMESTWPARPDAGSVLFVPLLVLVCGVLGSELLLRLRSPLSAVVPALGLAVFSQLHVASTGVVAVAAGLGLALLAGVVLATDRAGPRWPFGVVALAAAVITGLVLPTAAPRVALRTEPRPPAGSPLTSPLDQLAGRLLDPNVEVLRVTGAVIPDRWPLLVLDEFDGVNWAPGGRFRRLGRLLPPGPQVTVATRRRTAAIRWAGDGDRWLPSQTWPATVHGAEPRVDPVHGTLLRTGPAASGPLDYRLDWWEPSVDGADLARATVDPGAPGGLPAGGPAPSGYPELAGAGVGGRRPSFAAALNLESYLRTNYRLAGPGDALPTGHGWPQLTAFLRETRRGTSEQFAAAYVVLARLAGIPARLAVGYRTPPRPDPDGWYTVRNRDALAWPEVAVAGVGWVPLDPTAATAMSPAEGGLAEATAQARDVAPETAAPQPVPAANSTAPTRPVVPWWAVLLAVPTAAVMWPVAVPAAWTIRAWRRRRRPPPAAVSGAWVEARDRLSAYGVAVSSAMTPRDLAESARPVVGDAIAADIRRLGGVVDRALWSGAVPDAGEVRLAWGVVRAVRRGVPWRRRFRATLGLRGLRGTR